MIRTCCFLLCCLLGFLSGGAFADTYPAAGGSVAAGQSWTAQYFSSTVSGRPTSAQACADLGTILVKTLVAASATVSPTGCFDGATQYGQATRTWVCSSGTNNFDGTCTVAYSCPYGGTVSGSMCVDAPVCSSGEVRDVTGQCVASACQAGTAGESTFDVAYRTNTNTSDGSSLIADPVIPSSGCSGGCQVSVGMYSGGCWLKAAVGPPYVVSCAFNTSTTGQTCTASDETASAPLPPIPCPTGTAPGEVNGVGGCYKTGTSQTTTSAPTTNPDGSTTTTKTTTNPDGSTTTTTTTTNPDGSTSSTTTSSPAPIGSGTGGGGGVPGSGAGGSGDTEQAKFCQDNPEAALCQEKLKIDEEGTPEAKTDWTSEQDVLSTAINAIKDEVERGDWKQIDLGFSWNPPIPSGGCSAVQVFNYSIDICPALTKARELWGWVIYVLAALAIWIRGVRALQGV